MSRIVLRPIASPLVLGFLALGGATLVLSGQQLHWYGGPRESTALALTLALFAFPLQFLSAIFGFLARDVVVATAMGLLSANWLTTGAVKLMSPPGSTSAALGLLLCFIGVSLLVLVVAAALRKLLAALVLCTASARMLLDGIYQLTGKAAVQTAGGIVGLVLLGLALYAALALVLEEVRGRSVLPVLRVGSGRAFLAGSIADQVTGTLHEPGVREEL